jgi:AI-2 transport protein TqsA
MARVTISDESWRLLMATAALIVILAGLRTAAPLLLPLLVAAFLAIVCFPLVNWLRSRGTPTWFAVFVALLVVLAAVLVPAFVVHNAARQFAVVAPRYQERLQQMTTASLEWFEYLGVNATQLAGLLDSGVVLDLVGLLLSGLAALLSNAFLVVLTMAFILMEAACIPQKLVEALDTRPDELDRLRTMGHEVQHYLWIKTLVSLGTGVLVTLWVSAFGLEFALLWGLLAFLLNYIPNFGSILAAIPALLLSLIQLGPWGTMLIAIGYLSINTIIGNIVEPYVLGHRLQLSPLVVLLSLIFWGWMWGPVGMLLAVPMTMAIRIMLENSPDLRWIAVLLSEPGAVRLLRPPEPIPAVKPASIDRREARDSSA